MQVSNEPVASTGIAGLDAILGGGFPKDHVYLIQGDPGAGKTTLSLQFLLEGVKLGEKALYITLSETKRELHAVAKSHGWSLDGVEIHEHLVREETLSEEEDTTIFHPSEIELGQTVSRLLEQVERVNPQRVVLDSLSEIRLLSQSNLRYRKQILALKQYFTNRGATSLFLDDRTSEGNDLQLHSVPHGVIVLERRAPLYGSPRRRLEIIKLRGVDFRGGYHDFTIRRGGIELYPRLVAAKDGGDGGEGQLASGIAEIDALLGGGLDRGSSTLIMGPAGAGKSTLATQYAVAAAERGERAALFIFDESRRSLIKRSAAVGMELAEAIENGLITAQQVDPAELAPGEFANLVREAVEKHGARTVVIDSLNGYLNAMPEERFLTLHLHEMLTYLGDHGVATILVMAQHGLIGSNMISSVDVSYLADCVVLLRYYEADGELHKAVSVMKKRSGDHEKAIREFSMGEGGLKVGPPLKGFRGILTGIPIVEDR
ncbi:MAG: circadian clock protein KaiC [Thermoanaerobaculia bacterium]|jgi:circadian clock protein KaiC|nr:circadian clock protein KaiC [Thermoanaerobaculia bacterium]